MTRKEWRILVFLHSLKNCWKFLQHLELSFYSRDLSRNTICATLFYMHIKKMKGLISRVQCFQRWIQWQKNLYLTGSKKFEYVHTYIFRIYSLLQLLFLIIFLTLNPLVIRQQPTTIGFENKLFFFKRASASTICDSYQGLKALYQKRIVNRRFSHLRFWLTIPAKASGKNCL